MMTEAEVNAREALAKVHTPKLDELRTAVPKMRTSELLGLIVNAEALIDALGGVEVLNEDDPGPPKFKYTRAEEALIAAAALLALGNEIDRRIPVP